MTSGADLHAHFHDRHIRADIESFLAQDWSQVAEDFDAARFIALNANGSNDPAAWTIAYPDLDAYRDDWLRQSRETIARADPALLRDALFAGAKLAQLRQTTPGVALMLKTFNGTLPLRDGGSEPYSWQSLFTLHLQGDAWKITSFVGYLPLTGAA